jgi:hypothetical protein
MKFPVIEGPALIAAIHRFVRTIDANVHLARVAHDGQLLYAAELSEIAAKKVDHWKALRTVRRDLERRFPALREATMNIEPFPEGRPFDYFDTLVARMLAAPGDVDEGNFDDPTDGSLEPADILVTVMTEVLPGLAPAATESALADDRKAIAHARDALTVLRSATLLLSGVHGHARLMYLRDIVDGTNPSARSVAWYLNNVEVGIKHYYRMLFFDPGRIDAGELGWAEQFQLQVAAAVTTVEADLAARLNDRESVTWLVKRYAERCRRLKAPELLALLEKVTPTKERDLTRSMATYLFDQGLDVLIEVQLGASRYDARAPALLVEAKVCSTKTSALTALVRGLQQIASYEIQLRAERVTVDPVLVLFCIGGRPPDVPLEYTGPSARFDSLIRPSCPHEERKTGGPASPNPP